MSDEEGGCVACFASGVSNLSWQRATTVRRLVREPQPVQIAVSFVPNLLIIVWFLEGVWNKYGQGPHNTTRRAPASTPLYYLIMLYELVAWRNIQMPFISRSYICSVFISYWYRIFHFSPTKVQSQIFWLYNCNFYCEVGLIKYTGNDESACVRACVRACKAECP